MLIHIEHRVCVSPVQLMVFRIFLLLTPCDSQTSGTILNLLKYIGQLGLTTTRKLTQTSSRIMLLRLLSFKTSS